METQLAHIMSEIRVSFFLCDHYYTPYYCMTTLDYYIFRPKKNQQHRTILLLLIDLEDYRLLETFYFSWFCSKLPFIEQSTFIIRFSVFTTVSTLHTDHGLSKCPKTKCCKSTQDKHQDQDQKVILADFKTENL